MKRRAGLERELIVGDVRRRQRAGDLHIAERRLQGLSWKRIHEIEVEVAQLGGFQLLDRSMRVVCDVNTAQNLERVGIEALRAQGHAIDAGLGIA